MNKYFSVFLAFLLLASYTSGVSANGIVLSKDVIGNSAHYLGENWKFAEGDDSAMALPPFNDSQWKEISSTLNTSGASGFSFKGIGWFRLHFKADSSVAGRPLAMTITHFGASEIYLDGKLIKSFGHIKGADSSIYYDPQDLPFIFVIPSADEHVFAVRYANYNAGKNSGIYKESLGGFKMSVGETDVQIHQKDQRSTIASFILMLLSGIFFALCLIHLFMYLYYRNARSNLYFSILMLSLASIFVLSFVCYASHSPWLELKSYYLFNPAVIISGLALAGFINELFDKKKWRFKIIAAFGIITFILRVLDINLYFVFTIALIIGVSFEALFTVIFAIVKRVKGARIIGTGILFSTLFILTIFAIALSKGGNLVMNDSTVGGQIMVVFLGLSILSIPFSMSVYLAWNFSSINKDLALQLEQVRVLSQKTIEQEKEKQRLLESRKEELEDEVLKRTAELRDEKKKSDDLLLNILPSEVAEELKTKGSADAKHFDDVTVMFTDFKNFTHISEKLSPSELVAEIHSCFKAFDNIIAKHNIEKIKTIGDSYMCAGGLPVANTTNATDVVNAALEIQQFMQLHLEKRKKEGKEPFEIRIGIHSGPVVAGIVGVKKFAYDIWGDTVNIASRMESSGETGKVNISGSTYELVKDKFASSGSSSHLLREKKGSGKIVFTHRGKIQAKNKGEIDMYFVERSDIPQGGVEAAL